MMTHATIQEWHRLIAEHDFAGLDNILADDVVFHLIHRLMQEMLTGGMG